MMIFRSTLNLNSSGRFLHFVRKNVCLFCIICHGRKFVLEVRLVHQRKQMISREPPYKMAFLVKRELQIIDPSPGMYVRNERASMQNLLH